MTFIKGQVAWNKGKPNTWYNLDGCRTPEAIAKMSQSKKGKPSKKRGISQPQTSAEKNPKWMGDRVGYFALHHWINRRLGKPVECVYCGKENWESRLHWASISHKAKRDLNDYISLCALCHKNYDLKGGGSYGNCYSYNYMD